jgi:hypothetical protein
MRSLRRAAARFRDAGSIPLLAALLLIAAGAPLAAHAADMGERSRPNDSSDAGRSAQPRDGGGGAPSSPPSYSPPPSSAGGSEPRVAVPRSGGGNNESPSRQRPHNPSGSGRDNWDHRGGGWYGGGYYGPRSYYYGPYWGWGWGFGSWWWDDYYWYGPPYHRYGYGRYGYGDRYYDRYDSAGALDIDVSPGKTEVWIDGRYTGTADDFDGFPQYLWLDRGVYDVVLFREGYKTIARQITIRPGQVISMDDRLQPGESVRPEDLATKTHERRDERVRSEEERREEIARRDRDGMDDWRDRARRRMEERDRYEDEDRAEERSDDGSGRLRLEVEPSDASVYLDGRFVGTGIDLQRARNGLRLEPGEHRIAVVRPGHKAEEQEFTVAAGEEVELEFELDSVE